MTPQPPENAQESAVSGGASSLQMAQAHLNAHLASIDSLDSKMMFVIGFNTVVLSTFATFTAAIDLPPIIIVVPTVIASVVVVLSVYALRPREIDQFPDPSGLLEFEDQGWSDDLLAWAHVKTIGQASKQAAEVVTDKATVAHWTLLGTLAHVAAIVGSVLTVTS